MMHTINLNCGICGLKTGEHTLDPKFGWTGKETPESLGYVDIRCDACRLVHGEFRDMVIEYQAKVKGDPMEAEQFVKDNPKKQDFDINIQPLIPQSVDEEKVV